MLVTDHLQADLRSFQGLGAAPYPVTLWVGPISEEKVGTAYIEGSALATFPCTGSTACAAMADAWKGSDGRRLPAALKQLGLDPTSTVYLGSFSAGHAAAERLLLDDRDRAQIRAVMLADSMYGGGEGYIRYGVDAAADTSKLFVATVSDLPSSTTPTGVPTMSQIRSGIATRTGRAFAPGAWPATTPEPVETWSMGNVHFANYGLQTRVSHEGQVRELAPQLWRSYFGGVAGPPAIATSGGGGGGGTSIAPFVIGALVLGAVAAAVAA